VLEFELYFGYIFSVVFLVFVNGCHYHSVKVVNRAGHPLQGCQAHCLMLGLLKHKQQFWLASWSSPVRIDFTKELGLTQRRETEKERDVDREGASQLGPHSSYEQQLV